ncbi:MULTISPECIES: hypothetical protein [Frankia]|uniref:hypothetical protein n=1 Tax=Frankia TaxID=1854 RepID=UPI0012FF66DD|nr:MULTISPECIES: hypothetical protein [Frankia]
MPDWTVVPARRRLSRELADDLIGTRPAAAEPTITEATVAVDDDGAPVFAYLPAGEPQEVMALRRAVLRIRCEALSRAKGALNISRNFGFTPRRPVYGREGCQIGRLAAESPQEHRVLERWALLLERTLDQIDPSIVARDAQTMTQVDSSWRLGGGRLWTSGVINRSSALPYHRDRFNFSTWSAMPVLRRGIRGGYLALPEWGEVIACRDGWTLFFVGRQHVHGVTPMRTVQPDGYRFSVVFYALRGMKDCLSAAVETAYARQRRSQRERAMAARLAAGQPMLP